MVRNTTSIQHGERKEKQKQNTFIAFYVITAVAASRGFCCVNRWLLWERKFEEESGGTQQREEMQDGEEKAIREINFGIYAGSNAQYNMRAQGLLTN